MIAAGDALVRSTWRHVVAWDGPSMGGRLVIHLTTASGPGGGADESGAVAAARATERRATTVARRIDAWAARLTRFERTSDLSRLNSNPRGAVAVRPTLAAALEWAAAAGERSGGIVDVTLLPERLAAEAGTPPAASPVAEARPWGITRSRRGGVVQTSRVARFDLDGIAKGWLADRALALLGDFPGSIVDADGDIAIQLASGDELEIGVADPRVSGGLLTCMRLGPEQERSTYGVATSGVSVHRWGAGPARHHLIDPRTRRPAVTDVVQATVLATTAREAEMLAKTAVILGTDEGLAYLRDTRALAAILLTEGGDCVATPGSMPWLAAA